VVFNKIKTYNADKPGDDVCFVSVQSSFFVPDFASLEFSSTSLVTL
jgi:hypothetical protein